MNFRPQEVACGADIARVSFECNSYANGVDYAELGELAYGRHCASRSYDTSAKSQRRTAHERQRKADS